MKTMMGLPLSWQRMKFGRGNNEKLAIERNGFTYEASEVETLLIERVEVLTEAAQRARLLLHTLPASIEGAASVQEAAWTADRVIYEAYSALHYALEGSEPVLRQDPTLFDEISAFSEGSEAS